MENMVLNLGTPLFINHLMTTSMNIINQNISNGTFVGNGTFMQPNGRNVSTISSGFRYTNNLGGLQRVTG